jgi:predicted Zn-dependent protease
MSTSPEPIISETKQSHFAEYLSAEPVLLALLFLLAAISFSAVTGLSRLYQAQQAALGNRWYTRGTADLNAQKFDTAALEFRTALRYSRDNYSYQLNLAEALIGLQRTVEAQAYLVNLWDRQPENGFVNLELARIAAQSNDTEHALRYYHNAIYAAWPTSSGEDVIQRRRARVELIEYLLRINETTHAQAELIALAANLGDDPEQQRRLGDLFVRAQDYEHALAAYQLSLKADRHNAVAEANAGAAAFQLGQYRAASRYLQAAVVANGNDAQSASLLQKTELVQQLDPYEGGIPGVQRRQTVKHDFEIAGDRLKVCSTSASGMGSIATSNASQQNLSERWAQMKPRVTEHGLERDPDLTDSVMSLVFEIEQQTAASCGTPSGMDEALLLIEKSREGR